MASVHTMYCKKCRQNHSLDELTGAQFTRDTNIILVTDYHTVILLQLLYIYTGYSLHMLKGPQM